MTSNNIMVKDSSLDYSKVSFEDIVAELGKVAKLQSGEIQDFLVSSTGRLLTELFAATSEINFNYIQHALQESFLELARNKSSIIMGARSLGYSIRRPTPSSASFQIEVSGSVGSYEGIVSIPKFAKFNVNGLSFVGLDSYDFKWDNQGNIIGPEYGAKIVQGEFRTKKFFANPNIKFQKFIIEDESFSNYYGEDDPFYNDLPEYRVTRVKVGDSYWDITRKTLYSNIPENQPYVDEGILNLSKNKKCIIQTGNNGQIEILFGDGIISEIPEGYIEVTYLSTLGEAGNLFNSKNLLISYSGCYIENESLNFIPNTISENNVSFYLSSSALGGDNIESLVSIKLNAPKIYSALDKAVTKDDHIAILNTMPNVKYSIAYGEDDLGPGDYRYFNTVLFSILKNLYVRDAESPSELIPATPNQYIFSGLKTLDIVTKMQDVSGWATSSEAISEMANSLNLSPNMVLLNELDDIQKYEYYYLNFGNIFRLSSQQLEKGSELEYIVNRLKTKAMLTCRYLYMPPKVHKYRMKILVYVTPITSKNILKKTIEQAAYAYFRDNTRFNFPIYSSKIIKLIERIEGVVGCHVDFTPESDIPNQSENINDMTVNSRNIFKNEILETLRNIDIFKYNNPQKGLFTEMIGSDYSSTKYDELLRKLFTKTIKTINGNNIVVDTNKFNEKAIASFIEMIYAQTLGKLILNPYFNDKVVSLQEIVRTSDFNNPTTNENIFDTFVRWAVEFRKDTNYYSAKNVIDSKGDISNFTIPHEIAQIFVSSVLDVDVKTKI